MNGQVVFESDLRGILNETDNCDYNRSFLWYGKRVCETIRYMHKDFRRGMGDCKTGGQAEGFAEGNEAFKSADSYIGYL